MVTTESQSYSKRLLHLISWSHWFTFFNIIAAISLSVFYVYSGVHPDSGLGFIYLLTTWLSHMGFLTFMSFVLLIFPIILIYPKTRFIRAIASLVFTIELTLLLLDAFIFSRLGYHLNASSSEQIIGLIGELIAHNSLKFWLICGVASIVILTFELVVSNYAWKHLRALQQTVFARFVVFTLVLSFFVSHLLHVWADATLNYDVLKQDTILPLSYPTTAKTLLTKYGMFDVNDYVERRTSPLSFIEAVPNYPKMTEQCESKNALSQSAVIVLTAQPFTTSQIDNFAKVSPASSIKVNHHVDNALTNNAWFNLFYSLPTIYQQEIISTQSQPLIFQALNQLSNENTLTTVTNDADKNAIPQWLIKQFSNNQIVTDVSRISFSTSAKNFTEQLNTLPKGLHVVYFSEENNIQAELFVHALLLSQRAKQNQDVIWVSSIGNKSSKTSLSVKPTLFVLPNSSSKKIDRLTSIMDVQPTLMKYWLGCDETTTMFTNGEDLFKIKRNRIIANTMGSNLVVFNKDKSVLIDQNGNFESYSIKLEEQISDTSDFPLLIDGVHFIKLFSQQNTIEQ